MMYAGRSVYTCKLPSRGVCVLPGTSLIAVRVFRGNLHVKATTTDAINSTEVAAEVYDAIDGRQSSRYRRFTIDYDIDTPA